jgi:hypothetical protein
VKSGFANPKTCNGPDDITLLGEVVRYYRPRIQFVRLYPSYAIGWQLNNPTTSFLAFKSDGFPAFVPVELVPIKNRLLLVTPNPFGS